MRKSTTIIASLATTGCALLFAAAGGIPGSLAAGADRTAKEPPAESVTLPFFTDFAEESDLDLWTFVNDNEFYTWHWQNYSTLGGCTSLDQKMGVGAASDNWLVSPGFELNTGFNYRLEFYVMNWFESDMTVYLLDSAVPSTAAKTELYHYVGQDWGKKSIEFEVPAGGTYYIAFHDTTPWRENDTNLRYTIYIDDFRLEVLSNNAVPETPYDLRQIPGENGEISMGLEWTNPVKSKMGEDLDALSKVVVSRDGYPVATIESDVVPGRKMTWTDPAPVAGKHKYSVVVSNTTGDADAAEVDTFIGIDSPGAPHNISVDYDADGGVITVDWEEPEFGSKGGWFDRTGLCYRVVRQPGNKVLATDLRDEMIEDTDLSEYGSYVYQITTRTDYGLGATAESKGVMAGAAAPLPLIQGWENPASYAAWEIVDNNNDGRTLHVKHANGYESPSALGFDYSDTEVEKDESLFSPPVYLEKGKKYYMSFLSKTHIFGAFCLDVTYGKEKNSVSQKNNLLNLVDVTTGGDYAISDAEFTVSETGTYYFMWRLHDASHYVWFDNFEVREMLDRNLAITSVHNVSVAPTVGDEIVTGVSYVNRGSSKSSSFKVQLIDDDDKVLAEQNVSRPLASGGEGNANLKWTVPQATGKFGVRGRVIMEGDECEADNVSEPAYVNVQEKGMRGITIGTSTDISDIAPFARGFSYSQSIYKGEDFGNIAGYINSLSIQVRFGMDQDYPDVPFRIYLGNTDEENLSKGWIPAYMLTKVFEGSIDMNRGVYNLEIPFDKPFMYTGGNLCLFIVGDHDDMLFLYNGYGLATYVSEYGPAATRYLPYRFRKPDENNPEQSVGYYGEYVPNVTFYVDHSVTGTVSGTVTDSDGNPMEGVTVKGSVFPNLKTVTDAEGHYELPYFPVGNAYLSASAKGYADASAFGAVTDSEPAVIDFTNMEKLVEIKFTGSIVDGTDGKTPLSGAEIYLSGDNEITAVADDNGKFEIDGVYAMRSYPVFRISKEGYQTQVYDGMMFRGTPETPYVWDNIALIPVTASPYEVIAVDNGDKAMITWDEPVEDVVATKSAERVIGQLGGAEEINVGHRYLPGELAEMGVDGQYYVKSISFVPMSQSEFTLVIWQGEPGNEARAYVQQVKPSSIMKWNEFKLDKPFRIDPSKSIVVGYTVKPLVGAYPVGFDLGPAVEGGDCLFDPIANAWSTAHELLSGSMNYNWGIRAVFGNNPNDAPVEWVDTEDPARVRRDDGTMSLEDMAVNTMTPVAKTGLSELSMQLLDAPVAYMPVSRIPARTEVKGYNIYRLEPGQENSYTGMWTKLNDSPVTETSFVDESWSGIENKPYRFAVTSFYGNPSGYGDGVTSRPTFSDGVDKGRYATVTVNFNVDKGNADDAKVVLIGDGGSVVRTVTPGSSCVTFENVRYSDYSVLVMKPYYERILENVSIAEKDVALDYELNFVAKTPAGFKASDYIDEVRMSWEAPTSAVSGRLQWGNDIFGMGYAFNPGQEMIVGQRSLPEHRLDYAYGDFYITGIRFYAASAVTYAPLIWSENTFGNQIQEWRQNYTVSEEEAGTWVTVKLDNPIRLNPDYIYYYGYASTAPDAQTNTISIDEGPRDENGVYFYMYDQKLYKYNWAKSAANGNVMAGLEISDTPDPSAAKSEEVKFDIYRLASTDTEDESKWTKVNSSPVEGETYVDKTWKDLPDSDMRYAVKSVFFGDVPSGAAISKELKKGKVSLVKVDVTTNNGISPDGAYVTLSGISGKVAYRGYADADGHCEIPEVEKSVTYGVNVAHEGFDAFSQTLKAEEDFINISAELKEVKEVPGYVEAYPAIDNSNVEIKWRKPGAYAPAEGWAYWDNGTPLAGFGTSVGFCAVAQLFMPEDQEEKGMKELDITRISFFATSSPSNPVADNSYWVAKVWRINEDMTVDEVATQNAEGVELDKWNYVDFENPYHVDGTEMLLVGYEFHGAGNALGVDAGPCVYGKGDWANFGDGWQTLSATQPGFNFNNLIHTYCENLNRKNYEKAPALSEPQHMGGKPARLSVSRADLASKAPEHKEISRYEYPVKGYLVYRLPESDMENESTWKQLTSEPVTSVAFVDNTWSDVEKGGYMWAVKAVYASGSSAPAFCQFALDENGKVSDVEGIATDEIRVSVVSGGDVLVTVPADAMLDVFDVAGINVLSCGVYAGKSVVGTGLEEGMYLFRVTCGGRNATFRLMVK